MRKLGCLTFALFFFGIVFAMDYSAMIRGHFADAQEAEARGAKDTALIFYGFVTNVPEVEPYMLDRYASLRDIQKQAAEKISDEALRLKQEKKYEEALKVYEYAPTAYANEIQRLKKTIAAQDELKKIRQLADAHKYDEAYAILNKLKSQGVREAFALDKKIREEEKAWRAEHADPEQQQAGKWLFIRKMPGVADKEDSDVEWRIKNGNLELNLNANDLMTTESFADLIEQARGSHLPFILVVTQSGERGRFIHFFDGAVISSLMASTKGGGCN